MHDDANRSPAGGAAGPFIELGRFLKAMQVAESGGEAKHLARSGAVRVNGEVETRRGRKLRPGDLVEVEDPEEDRLHRLRVHLDDDTAPPGAAEDSGAAP